MKLFGSLAELVSILYRKNSQQITVRPSQSVTYTADRDVQLPAQDADSVLVSRTSTDTLTNKTLTSPVINTPTGITKSDIGLGNVDNTSDATKNSASVTLTNKTLGSTNTLTGATAASFTNTGTVTLFTASDTVVGKATTDTLTNKTINGASNTLTVLAGTQLSGQVPTANGGTGQNSTATFPTSGVVVTEAAAETLTNKTLTSPTIGTPVLSSYQDLTEIATPASPGAGIVRFYSKSGDGLYYKNSGGTESQLSTTSVATPTAAGTVTSYFPTIQSAVRTTDANYTITTTDGFGYFIINTTASRTLTLPAASANAGRVIKVKKTSSSTANTLIISRAGSDTIDGATSYTLTQQYDSLTIVCDGSATWSVISSPIVVPGTIPGLVSSSGLTGSTAGTAITAGYVGEKVSATITAYTLTTSVADVTGASISLTAGVWRIFYAVSADLTTGATSGNASEANVLITDNANTVVGTSYRGLFIKTVAAVANNTVATLCAEEIVSISATTTYKLRALRADAAGTGSGSITASGNTSHASTFYAVRIA